MGFSRLISVYGLSFRVSPATGVPFPILCLLVVKVGSRVAQAGFDPPASMGLKFWGYRHVPLCPVYMG